MRHTLTDQATILGHMLTEVEMCVMTTEKNKAKRRYSKEFKDSILKLAAIMLNYTDDQLTNSFNKNISKEVHCRE